MKNVNEMVAAELRTIAREHNMPGAWKATKAEMLEFLNSIGYEAENVQDEPEIEVEEVIEEENEVAQNEPETAEEETVEEESTKKPRGKQIEYNGKSQTLNKWADELGFTPQTLYARLYISNWTVEKAFTTPSKRMKKEEA